MQGVAYIHGNKTHPDIDGGDFVLYPNGPYGPKVTFPAKHNTAIFIDGTKTAHGVEFRVFRFFSMKLIISNDT